jgi:hypothetical protein
MSQKQLLLKRLRTAAFAAALLLGTSAVFAQVKVGSNPTTINANSNLEVEAANGKKVQVKKDVGTMVIENTPSGALTDSIMTIDATGNVKAMSRTALTAPVAIRPYLRLRGSMPAMTTGANVIVTNLPANLQNKITYTPGNGQMRITEAGVYFFAVTGLGPNRPDAPAGVFDFCHYVLVNGSDIGSTCSRSNGGAGIGSANTGIYRLNVNDVVSLLLTTSSSWNGGGSYNFSVSLYKLSD